MSKELIFPNLDSNSGGLSSGGFNYVRYKSKFGFSYFLTAKNLRHSTPNSALLAYSQKHMTTCEIKIHHTPKSKQNQYTSKSYPKKRARLSTCKQSAPPSSPQNPNRMTISPPPPPPPRALIRDPRTFPAKKYSIRLALSNPPPLTSEPRRSIYVYNYHSAVSREQPRDAPANFSSGRAPVFDRRACIELLGARYPRPPGSIIGILAAGKLSVSCRLFCIGSCKEIIPECWRRII